MICATLVDIQTDSTMNSLFIWPLAVASETAICFVQYLFYLFIHWLV